MADTDLNSAVQLLSMTGRGVLAIVKVASTGTAAIVSGLTAIAAASGKAIQHWRTTGQQSLKALNQSAARTGAALEEVPVTDSDCKKIVKELRRYGVDFSLYKDPAGQHHIVVKAANLVTLNLAMEKVAAKNISREQSAQPQKPTPEPSRTEPQLDHFDDRLNQAAQKAKAANAAREARGRDVHHKSKPEQTR